MEDKRILNGEDERILNFEELESIAGGITRYDNVSDEDRRQLTKLYQRYLDLSRSGAAEEEVDAAHKEAMDFARMLGEKYR